MRFEHIEFLVEETSAEAALKILLPKIVSRNVTYRIHPFQGKYNLFRHLPHRLLGYRNSLPASSAIFIIFDEDRQNCQDLKADVEKMVQKAGLHTKSFPTSNGNYEVVIRMCVEELEAWFFGDVPAIHAAYPRVSATLAKRKPFRDADAIGGGTWEALQRVLQKNGYHRAGLAKTKAARDICTHMNPHQNTSRSFCVFRDTLQFLTPE